METVKTNSIKAWLLAARPKTLAGAAVPVMLGCALAAADGWFQIVPAILCFLFAFLMQIDANFINDFFDYLKGSDREDRLGPERACAQGWGDVLVIIVFGFVPVGCTYYVMCHDWTWNVTIASVVCGMIIDTLLMVNNYRDREQDALSGKKTLVVRWGAATGRMLYLFLGLAAAWLCLLFAVSGHIWAAILPQIYILPHFLTWPRMVKINKGKELNIILGETSRNMLLFGILLTLGLIL